MLRWLTSYPSFLFGPNSFYSSYSSYSSLLAPVVLSPWLTWSIDRISIKQCCNLRMNMVNPKKAILGLSLISTNSVLDRSFSVLLRGRWRIRWNAALHFTVPVNLNYDVFVKWFAYLKIIWSVMVVRRSNKGPRLTSCPANESSMSIKTSASLSTSISVGFTPSLSLTQSISSSWPLGMLQIPAMLSVLYRHSNDKSYMMQYCSSSK